MKLSTIMRYARQDIITSIRIKKLIDNSGRLEIWYQNKPNTCYFVDFASYDVLRTWLENKRNSDNWRGTVVNEWIYTHNNRFPTSYSMFIIGA